MTDTDRRDLDRRDPDRRIAVGGLLLLLRDELTPAAGPRPLTADQVHGLVVALEAATATTSAAGPHPRHGWSLIDDAAARRVDPEAVLAAAERLDAAVEAVRGVAAAAAIDRVRDPADLVAAASVLASVLASVHASVHASPQAFPIDTVERAADPRWRAAGQAAITRLRAFSSTDHPVLQDLDRSGLDLPLDQLRRDAQAAVDGSILGRRRRLHAVAARFGPALRATARSTPARLPQVAEAAIEVRAARDAATHAVFSVPGLTAEAGDPFDSAWPDRLDARRTALMDLADRWAGVRAQSPLRALVEDVLRRRTTVPEGLPALLTELAAAVEGVRRQLGTEPETWLAGDGWPAAWRATAADRALGVGAASGAGAGAGAGATTLRCWLDHLAGLRPLHDLARTPGLRSLHQHLVSGAFPIEEAARAIELAVAMPALEEHAPDELLATGRPHRSPSGSTLPG